MRTLRWIVIMLLAVAAVYAISRISGAPSIAAGSTLVVELSGNYVEAPDNVEKNLRIDAAFVREKLGPLVKDEDLSRYIL